MLRLKCEHEEPIAKSDAGMLGCMIDFIIVDKDKNMTVTFKEGVEQKYNSDQRYTDTLQKCRVFFRIFCKQCAGWLVKRTGLWYN